MLSYVTQVSNTTHCPLSQECDPEAHAQPSDNAFRRTIHQPERQNLKPFEGLVRGKLGLNDGVDFFLGLLYEGIVQCLAVELAENSITFRLSVERSLVSF